ncbi:hypothetical protein [Ligilactobacillus apodemi]|uniref:hypothetical protein n=1 Tax=Ligilactobacillus apodemi TaxID=307126 RepID=UPI00046A3485|nr:hypothetical protein [Ligilactobacillus apodemi]
MNIVIVNRWEDEFANYKATVNHKLNLVNLSERYTQMKYKIDDNLYSKMCSEIEDPMFRVWLQLLFTYNAYLRDMDNKFIDKCFHSIPECDLKIAAIEFFQRKGVQLKLSDKEKKFFARYNL